MKVLILGTGKTGTTALYYAIKEKMNGTVNGFFEPSNFLSVCNDISKCSQNVIVKWLFGTFKDEYYDKLKVFDKIILIVRDPRDILVSRFLYRSRDMGFIRDKEKLSYFLNLLKRKEREPDELSLYDLFKAQDALDDNLYKFGNPDAFVGAKKQLISFWRNKPDHTFCLKYEDYIDGKIDDLNLFLTLKVERNVAVAKKHQRVVRSKAYGEWKHWFTEKDLKIFKPICNDYIKLFKYDTSWKLNHSKKILSETSSEYVRRICEEKLAHSAQLKNEGL